MCHFSLMLYVQRRNCEDNNDRLLLEQQPFNQNKLVPGIHLNHLDFFFRSVCAVHCRYAEIEDH
jgi:hypothetical protein